MSVAIISTRNLIGRRDLRPYGHGLYGDLGQSQSDVNQWLLDSGYSQGEIDTLVAMGATVLQLVDLYEGNVDYPTLVNELGGGLTRPTSLPPSASAASSVNTPFGTLDLTDISSWDLLAGIFESTRNDINALLVHFLGDQQVIANQVQLNGLIQQFSDLYQQVWGTQVSGLSGLGQWWASVLQASKIIGTLLAILFALFDLKQWIAQKQTQATTAQITGAAQSANLQQAATLRQQAAAAMAAQNPQAAAYYANLAAQASGAGIGATDWAAWLKSNLVPIGLFVAAVAILPPLIKKI